MACAVCGASNEAAVRFCTNCGRPMAATPGESNPQQSQPEGTTCSACGAPNIATVRFCTNCGRSLTPVAGA
ncbi:MAG: zinc-ribbon domain-containing protein [Dehalococcoidia bacterium]